MTTASCKELNIICISNASYKTINCIKIQPFNSIMSSGIIEAKRLDIIVVSLQMYVCVYVCLCDMLTWYDYNETNNYYAKITVH